MTYWRADNSSQYYWQCNWPQRAKKASGIKHDQEDEADEKEHFKAAPSWSILIIIVIVIILIVIIFIVIVIIIIVIVIIVIAYLKLPPTDPYPRGLTWDLRPRSWPSSPPSSPSLRRWHPPQPSICLQLNLVFGMCCFWCFGVDIGADFDIDIDVDIDIDIGVNVPEVLEAS